jgi:hypothetical protein
MNLPNVVITPNRPSGLGDWITISGVRRACFGDCPLTSRSFKSRTKDFNLMGKRSESLFTSPSHNSIDIEFKSSIRRGSLGGRCPSTAPQFLFRALCYIKFWPGKNDHGFMVDCLQERPPNSLKSRFLFREGSKSDGGQGRNSVDRPE